MNEKSSTVIITGKHIGQINLLLIVCLIITIGGHIRSMKNISFIIPNILSQEKKNAFLNIRKRNRFVNYIEILTVVRIVY